MKRQVGMAILAMAVLSLLACNDSDGDSTGTSPSAGSDTSSITSTPAPAARQGGSVQDGDTVEVNYRGTLDDGAEFDSSYGRAPLSFVVGQGQLIPGFEGAVMGLTLGDKVTVRLEAGDAYGEPSDDMIFEVPRAQAPEDVSEGDQVQLNNGAAATIVQVTSEVVRIDANHPLAGKALTFEIEVVSINALAR